jgi:hypothetical protein
MSVGCIIDVNRVATCTQAVEIVDYKATAGAPPKRRSL